MARYLLATMTEQVARHRTEAGVRG
jgi:hypothetical protein